MKDKIESAIRETLVIENKQSLGIAMDKIMKIIAENDKLKEAKILSWRNRFNVHCTDLCYLGYTESAHKLMEEYDNHFGIQTVKEGKVGDERN